MNQFAPISTFKSYEPLSDVVLAQKISISGRVRRLAAQFQMHHALIHRLGPHSLKLRNATYISTLRTIENTEWTLGTLLSKPALDGLLAGNRAVLWHRNTSNMQPKNDPLNRLNISCGVSVPFHNALGNHAALTLCDSIIPDIDLVELTRLSLPLVDEILSAERARHTIKTALTQRECDCLQWAAAGKTSIETGIILGLSPHTINQYLSAATVKLKAVNRTHAVTKAAQMGLINLSAI